MGGAGSASSIKRAMASLMSEVVDISVASGSVRREMDDGRGFTTAGGDHTAPLEFNYKPASPSKRVSSGTKKTTRLRAFPIPAPAVAPVSLEELDLEDTLVEGDAFMSSSSGGQGSGERNAGRGGGYYTESSAGGNLSSYSKAVNRGRLESVGNSHVVS